VCERVRSLQVVAKQAPQKTFRAWFMGSMAACMVLGPSIDDMGPSPVKGWGWRLGSVGVLTPKIDIECLLIIRILLGLKDQHILTSIECHHDSFLDESIPTRDTMLLGTSVNSLCGA
jgi:hypothetical protein